jgi:hypothetical protein
MGDFETALCRSTLPFKIRLDFVFRFSVRRLPSFRFPLAAALSVPAIAGYPSLAKANIGQTAGLVNRFSSICIHK